METIAHISYFGNETDVAAPYGLKYARWNGSDWVIKFIDVTGLTEDKETSIVLDSQGNRIIIITDWSRDLKYAYFDEGTQAWVIEIVDPVGDVGETNSLRLDSNELPRIAYWDATQQNVRYARFNGTKWVFSTVEDLTCASPLAQRVSLALDSKDRPHVSYHDCALPTRLKYALQVSGTWTTRLVEEGNNSGLVAPSK
jgi:hypothetical protein